MPRYDYYTKITQENDIEIHDILSLNFQNFTFTSQPTVYLVNSVDVLKPWFISQRFFGTVEYTHLVKSLPKVEPLFGESLIFLFIAFFQLLMEWSSKKD